MYTIVHVMDDVSLHESPYIIVATGLKIQEKHVTMETLTGQLDTVTQSVHEVILQLHPSVEIM